MKIKSSRLELIHQYEEAPSSALFSQATVAALLDCSLATIERDRWEGTGIPFVKIGRMVRYRKADIDTWLRMHVAIQSTSQGINNE